MQPILSWPDLAEAKHYAESFVLMSLPPDPGTGARIARDNAAGHSMGPPLNRQPSRETAIYSDWGPSHKGFAPDIPAFLLRKASNPEFDNGRP
jgi:hypothetical protein